MQSNIKLTQIIAGLALFLSGLFFVIITLLVSLLPSLIVTKSVIVWILVPLFLIFFIEASLYWIIQSFAIKEENMQDLRKKGILSQGGSVIALFFRYKSIFSSIFLILFFLALITGVIYYFVPLLSKGITFSTQFYILLGIYLAYFLILRRFVMKFLLKAGKFAREQLPVCSVEKEGVVFNLPFKKGKIGIVAIITFIAGIAAVIFGKIGMTIPLYISIGIFIILFFVIALGGRKSIVSYPVKIKFSEIQEIKSLSFVEAQSLLNYKIGPDVTLQVQSVRDMINFLRDPTNSKNRPNTYTLILDSSGAKTILIRGLNLFYLIAISDENADELVREIQRHIS